LTKRKPADIFFDRSSKVKNQELVGFRRQPLEDVRGWIERRQNLTNGNFTKGRQDPITYKANKQITT